MQKILLVLFSVFLFSSTNPVVEVKNTHIVWEDHFTQSEKEKLTNWLHEVSSAIAETLGKYPFEVKLYIHRSDNANEPVPWAHTIRNSEQAVNFYVNPHFTLKEFKADWTAPHEISHLSIPFMGKENMWFSEGYASYMQYQVMWQQGVLTTAQTKEKYALKLRSNIPKYNSDENFLVVSRQLKSKHNYPAVYWGGACYFIQADSILRLEKNRSLNSVIRKYQQNGRNSDRNLNDLISSLDRISESNIFSDLIYIFQKGSAKEAVLNTPI